MACSCHHGINSWSGSKNSENEYELLPEFEIPGKNKNQSSQSNQCSCQQGTKTDKESSGDPATGWEGDNESFTKRSAELHLKNHFRLNDTIKQVNNCCVDPDFFTRKCEFVTSGNLKGAVLWSPLNKQATIMLCIKGQRHICWYEYFIQKGQLHLRHKKCLKKPTPCSTI
jgi:hypothetical protein